MENKRHKWPFPVSSTELHRFIKGRTVDSGDCFGDPTVKLRTGQLQPGVPGVSKTRHNHAVSRETATLKTAEMMGSTAVERNETGMAGFLENPAFKINCMYLLDVGNPELLSAI